tara:strand:+ start:544 stop:2781 length:2238 start_codon:yes stop_codon:yes gene_type:complete
MAGENYQRSRGVQSNYKKDVGGTPADSGPFIGEVTNNVDPTRSGRLQVFLTHLAGSDKNNKSLWRTVNYLSPFYGITQQSAPQPTGPGSFTGNNQSYGFWGTPPDLGTKVLCFFVDGDPSKGYYMGMPIEPGLNHMVPAIGASDKYVDDSNSPLFANKPKLPVVEINNANPAISENPRFFEETKPVHSVLAGQMLSQGVIAEPLLGPITSNSQRESPSNCFGISTPGRPVYSGGLTDAQLQQKINSSTLQANEVNVIGRKGGHSIVMDDGSQANEDNLIRLRTSSGHQIMMNDTPDGQTIHIMHANGQSWVELGKEGTIDVYASNSLNIRSAGEINMHADRNININSENGTINMNAKAAMSLESASLNLTGTNSLLAYSKSMIGLKSDASLMLKSNTGSWGAGSNLTLEAGCIKLNSGAAPDVPKAQAIPKRRLPDTKFEPQQGWIPEPAAIQTIVTRAPTHEPYAERGTGVNTSTNLATSSEEVPLDDKTKEAVEKTDTTEITKMDKGDYEAQDAAKNNVGKLGTNKVTGMLAQASKSVPQGFNEISNTGGVGKFGFDATELEGAGFLKPGTADFFLKDATSNLNTVLSSSSVWSGNQGINGLSDFLNNESIQDITKNDLFTKGLNGLQNAGIVTGLENDADLAGLVTGASKFGVDAVKKWTEGSAILGKTLNGANSGNITAGQMNELVAGGKYAVNLTTQKISSEIQGFTTGVVGATGTVVRTEIDTAVQSVIASQKVTGIET